MLFLPSSKHPRPLPSPIQSFPDIWLHGLLCQAAWDLNRIYLNFICMGWCKLKYIVQHTPHCRHIGFSIAAWTFNLRGFEPVTRWPVWTLLVQAKSRRHAGQPWQPKTAIPPIFPCISPPPPLLSFSQNSQYQIWSFFWPLWNSGEKQGILYLH